VALATEVVAVETREVVPDPATTEGETADVMDLGDLLAVQEIDTRIDQLRHQHENMPEREREATARKQAAALEEQLREIEAERGTVAAAQQKLEREVAALEAKKAHASAQPYGGSVVAHKDLEALQNEIDTLGRLMSEIEDRILEQMELAEPLDERLADLAPRVDAARAELVKAENELTVAAGAVDDEVTAAEAERTAAAARVPEKLLGTYDALRGRLGGVGAARLDGARCTGCHLEIPAGELTEVRRAPADEVVYCPECGRILVR
jgi:predicted  nucleic acid-binding Zn-ribbon protein